MKLRDTQEKLSDLYTQGSKDFKINNIKKQTNQTYNGYVENSSNNSINSSS